MTLDVINDFRDILEDNINNINKDNFSEDSTVTFFQNLLSINYLYNYKESYNFSSDIFAYNIILTNENYFKIKNYIKEFYESQPHEKDIPWVFNEQKFREYYSELVTYIFDSRSIEDGLRYIINNLEQENGEFGLVLNNLAHTLIYGSEGYPPLFRVSDEFKQLI